MNVDIVTEAAQFPKKESINGIFVAVYRSILHGLHTDTGTIHAIKTNWIFGKIFQIKLLHISIHH
jgi:hypothetical protein